MHVNYIIVGQGIAGSLLYYTLTKAGADCVVIDENKPNSASRVAAGLINPVTGRRLVKSWMIDELIPSFKDLYREIETDFNISCLEETVLTWHLPATDIVEAFNKRIGSGTEFLDVAGNEQDSYFNFPFKIGDIRPCYIVNVQLILDSLRSAMKTSGRLVEEKFDHQQLSIINAGVRYNEIVADKIIFCEGYAAIHNPWFAQLPYSLNKGEALIVSIKDLPANQIYKFRQTLVPLPGERNLWWYGSNYVWHFKDDRPTNEYREAATKELQSWLKLSFSVEDHKAAIRYATVERRPFIGFHPVQPRVGIFNGWGTKGCSLVPYFARQFTDHLMNPLVPIHPEADIKRFSKLLSVKGPTF